jgi:hypothetical protein
MCGVLIVVVLVFIVVVFIVVVFIVVVFIVVCVVGVGVDKIRCRGSVQNRLKSKFTRQNHKRNRQRFPDGNGNASHLHKLSKHKKQRSHGRHKEHGGSLLIRMNTAEIVSRLLLILSGET